MRLIPRRPGHLLRPLRRLAACAAPVAVPVPVVCLALALGLLVASGCTEGPRARTLKAKARNFVSFDPEPVTPNAAAEMADFEVPEREIPPEKQAGELIDQGRKLFESNRIAEAKTYFQRLSVEYDEDPEVWRWLGDLHYNLVELDEAMAAYARAIELQPSNYLAHRGVAFATYYRGVQLASAQQHDRAHVAFERALRRIHQCARWRPDDLEALFVRAKICEGASRKLYRNAAAYYNDGQPQLGAAEALNCIQVLSEGIEAARKRAAKFEKEAESRMLLARMLHRRAVLGYHMDKTKQAVADLQLAVRIYRDVLANINPKQPLAKQRLAQVEERLDAYQKRIKQGL